MESGIEVRLFSRAVKLAWKWVILLELARECIVFDPRIRPSAACSQFATFIEFTVVTTIVYPIIAKLNATPSGTADMRRLIKR